MFDQEWAWHDSELDIVRALRRQGCAFWKESCPEGDAFAIQTMRNHWEGFYPDAALDSLRDYGVTHVRIPVGYWIMDAPVRARRPNARPHCCLSAIALQVGGTDPREFGFQSEGFVTGGLRYLEALLPRLKRRGMRAMIDMHAVPGCGSSCQSYAGVFCGTPTFW